MKKNLFSFLSIIVGLICSVFWLIIGIAFYLNILLDIPALNAISGLAGTKYILYFLWGIPLLATVLGMIFIKNKWIKISLVSFLVGSIIFIIIVSYSDRF